MKKCSAILILISLLILCAGCSSGKLKRGKWEDGCYYNPYGNFKIVTNSYFEIYDDSKIKEDTGAVYVNDALLNDMIISSDYCAVIVTMERTSDKYTQSDYVSMFISNTKNTASTHDYELGDSNDYTIAGRVYTCVPVRYVFEYEGEKFGYYEYNFINKTDTAGVFTIIRVTGGSEGDITTALALIKENK